MKIILPAITEELLCLYGGAVREDDGTIWTFGKNLENEIPCEDVIQDRDAFYIPSVSPTMRIPHYWREEWIKRSGNLLKDFAFDPPREILKNLDTPPEYVRMQDATGYWWSKSSDAIVKERIKVVYSKDYRRGYGNVLDYEMHRFATDLKKELQQECVMYEIRNQPYYV